MTTPLNQTLLNNLVNQPNSKIFLQEGNNTTTYKTLQQQINQTTSLLNGYSLQQGDRIFIASNHKKEVSVLYLTCLINGLTAVVVDPEATASELTTLFMKVEPKAAFIDQPLIEKTNQLKQKEVNCPIITISGIAKAKSPLLILKSKPKNPTTYPALLATVSKEKHPVKTIDSQTPALILFTSGTTSQPKGVVLTQQNLAAQMHTLQQQFQLTSQHKIANHLPLHHSDGLNQGALLTLFCGASWLTSHITNLKDTGGLLDAIYQQRVSHLVTVPTVLSLIAQLPSEYHDSFSSDEFCFIESTAGYLNPTLWQQIEATYKTTVVNCYGLTETVCESFFCGPDSATRKMGTIGKPINCQAKIVNSEGIEVPQGQTGELLLKSDYNMQGYFNNPEATAATFTSDGWLKTGDLARCEEGFYSITGRIKNIIIRGGINLYPEDITEILQQHPEVTGAATIGVSDDLLGERAISCVTCKNPVTSEALFAFCKQQLNLEKLPNKILVVDSLPYGPSGKIDLPALKAQVNTLENSQGSVDSSLSAADKVITLAAQVFHVTPEELTLNATEDQVENWSSIALLELIVVVEKAFQITMQPKDIMSIQSLQDIVTIVNAHKV